MTVEEWPWLNEEDSKNQIDIAADVLGISAAALAEDADLLEAVRIG